MKNAEFVALVKLLRDYDLDPPMYYFRCSQHQFCLQQLRSSEMDGYIDSSRCFLDTKLKETGSNSSLDISLPQLRYMQADPLCHSAATTCASESKHCAFPPDQVDKKQQNQPQKNPRFKRPLRYQTHVSGVHVGP